MLGRGSGPYRIRHEERSEQSPSKVEGCTTVTLSGRFHDSKVGSGTTSQAHEEVMKGRFDVQDRFALQGSSFWNSHAVSQNFWRDPR